MKARSLACKLTTSSRVQSYARPARLNQGSSTINTESGATIPASSTGLKSYSPLQRTVDLTTIVDNNR